jgi:hypothetical protein
MRIENDWAFLRSSLTADGVPTLRIVRSNAYPAIWQGVSGMTRSGSDPLGIVAY